MEHAKLTIEGMSCAHCVRAVESALEGLPGVSVDEVEVGSASISYDPGQGALEQAERAIEEEGYRVSGRAPR